MRQNKITSRSNLAQEMTKANMTKALLNREKRAKFDTDEDA